MEQQSQESRNLAMPAKVLFPNSHDTLIDALPPHDADAEKAAIGAALNSPEAIEKLIHLLHPVDFYATAHQKIFQRVIDLHARKAPVDLITLSNELKRRGELEEIGGAYYLTGLMSGTMLEVVARGNVDYHIGIIQEKARKRRRIEIGLRLIETSRNGATEDKFDGLLAELEGTKSGMGSGPEDFIEALPPDKLALEILVENFAIVGAITTVVGRSGTFKSLYTQWVLNKHGVLSLYLVDLDLSSFVFFLRQRAMERSHVIPMMLNPNTNITPDFYSERFWRELDRTVADYGVKVVVFDTLLDFIHGDYNRADTLNLALQRCRDFAAKRKVALILISHTTKQSWSRDELNLSDVADSRIVVTKSDLVLGLQCTKSRQRPGVDLLRLTMLKNRLGMTSEALTCEVVSPEDHPRGFFDFVKTTEKFSATKSSAVEEAAVDLREYLREESRPAKDAFEYMRSCGHSEKVIRVARERICKKPKKSGDGWYWELEDAKMPNLPMA